MRRRVVITCIAEYLGLSEAVASVWEFLSRNDSRVRYWHTTPASKQRPHRGLLSSPEQLSTY